MMQALIRWLNGFSIANSLRYRQAKVLQVLLLITSTACIIGFLRSLFFQQGSDLRLASIGFLSPIITSLICIALLRKGYFRFATVLAIVLFISAIGITLIATGFEHSSMSLLAFSVPIIIGGFMLESQGLLLSAGLCILWAFVVTMLSTINPAWVAFSKPQRTPFSSFTTFTLIISTLAMMIGQFVRSIRHTLELQVAERTTALQQAISEREQRAEELQKLFEDLQASRSTVQKLSATVIPVLDGVLVTPLIGDFDPVRIDYLRQMLFERIEAERARSVIFDVSGMTSIDSSIAQALRQLVNALRLMGASSILVGIGAELASVFVKVGLELSHVRIYANLREAVTELIQEQV